jgi:hypothetical protein
VRPGKPREGSNRAAAPVVALEVREKRGISCAPRVPHPWNAAQDLNMLRIGRQRYARNKLTQLTQRLKQYNAPPTLTQQALPSARKGSGVEASRVFRLLCFAVCEKAKSRQGGRLSR